MMRLIAFILLLHLLFSCNYQSATEKSNFDTPTEELQGIVYFSEDNGSSWYQKSDGLPLSTTVGAIAVSDKSLGLLSKENGVYLFDFEDGLWKNLPTENEITVKNPTAVIFLNNHLYVGTQRGGVYVTNDMGRNWKQVNQGLRNLTIRRFSMIGDQLYVGTNAGLYSLKENSEAWELEYGNNTMQVNGITEFKGCIYIGTTQGAFISPIGRKDWKNVLSDYALHNISSDDKYIYAMTYNVLFSSGDNGASWQSLQHGLPKELYTFNVIKKDNAVFAGQWDGVYKRDDNFDTWQKSAKGLPDKLSITNMKTYRNFIVVSGNKIGLRKGTTIDKENSVSSILK